MSFRRITGVWLLLCGAMVGNGIFREAVLVPTIRRKAADIASAALGIMTILSVTRPFLRRAEPGASPGRVAVIWLTMTIAFETLFGRYGDHKSWRELAGDYAIWKGKLWPVVLLAVPLAPFLWMRRTQPAAETPAERTAAPDDAQPAATAPPEAAELPVPSAAVP